MEEHGFVHKSVLLYETVGSLNIKPSGIYVDGTLGGGGHAYEVCSRLGKHGRLIGIDQDADAIAAATKRLEPFADKVTVVRSNYENIASVLHDLGIEKVDGIAIWTWGFLPISWIQRPEALLTGKMYLLICVWIREIQRRRLILSMSTARWSCIA